MVQEKKKRVNYSWMNDKQSMCAKAFIAACARKIKWEVVLNDKFSRSKIFKKHILPKVLAQFPTLFGKIKAYYIQNGRVLNECDYHLLLYARFVNMFDFDVVNYKVMKTNEHPDNSENTEFKIMYIKAQKMYKSSRVWGTKIKPMAVKKA